MSSSETEGAADFRLHHVGQVVQDVASAAEDLCRRFKYKRRSAILHDPQQTALVLFLQLPPDPAYLELVAPDGERSKLTAVARKGGGLHHLCFTVSALGAAIDHLSENGLRLISDPVPAVAFSGRRICWLLGRDRSLIELVERREAFDLCTPAPAL